MGRLKCRSCKALLPKRGARCRNCGWASDYGNWTDRRERELLLGIGLMVLAGCMALGVAIAIAYIKSL